MQKHDFLKVLIGSTAFLLIPLIAMQLTDQVNWTGSDFAIAWVLLIAIGLGLKMALSEVGNQRSRVIGLIIVLGILWLWAELAVGVFTNWGS